MKANRIIIVPETHWDREWYLPFQEYRARLVIMMDKLLNILKNDVTYKNFTFDGQTIPIEDYLEVRPEKEEEIKHYVKEKRLSIGPMYILPDEFLVSGESMIMNLIIGHQIARKFGGVMKAGYIPDPFGHFAQLPQILSGCEIPSILFMRGFDDTFEKDNLNMEFIWNAPGNSASVLGIHLILGYGSIADLTLTQREGKFKGALRNIKRTVSRLEREIATPIVLLNSGSDHHEAKAEVPEIIRQWNAENPEQPAEQNDFEYYVNKVLENNPELKSYQGELRGGRYFHLLPGILSARMWIKQRNTAIEYLYEKYTEPLCAMTWALDKYSKFEYPAGYILTGLKWLIKNHPHDSICGCSIDQVHDEMKTRFDWAEQIANEIYKSSFLSLSDLIDIDSMDNEQIALFVHNPLPWKRKDIVKFNLISLATKGEEFLEDIKITDSYGKEIQYQHHFIEEEPRFIQESNISHEFTFLADVPACGYKCYYVIPGEKPKETQNESDNFKLTENSIENEFYRIIVNNDCTVDLLDKKSSHFYKNICKFEDVGDWGDEYDFSGPKANQTDLKYTSEDASLLGISPVLNGPTQKMLQIRLLLRLPLSLTEDRFNRMTFLAENPIHLYISLYKGINRIDFKIELENNSKDHRIRVIFPTGVKATQVYADGHFYVIPRNVEIPDVKGWGQNPLPSNHQKDFISVNDDNKCIAVLNKGLPEYEAIREKDGSISLAVTLLRCIEWLSRGDLATRFNNAGPDLNTPGAQCIGKHTFELSLVIENEKGNWLESEIHVKGKEFNTPLRAIFPFMTATPMRGLDKLLITPLSLAMAHSMTTHKKTVEPYLPSELSFLEIDNKKVMLSILKKAETGEPELIIRCYNISNSSETANLKLTDIIKVNKVEIVNLLEEKPINVIKAKCEIIEKNIIQLRLEPHVIATLKISHSVIMDT